MSLSKSKSNFKIKVQFQSKLQLKVLPKVMLVFQTANAVKFLSNVIIFPKKLDLKPV